MKKGKNAGVEPRVQVGVTFEVRGTELMARITRRIAWHKRHGAQHDGALKKLLGDPRALTEWRTNAAWKDLSERVREHEERGAYLDFVKAHLKAETVYRLDAADLRALEIMPARVHWT